MYLLERENTRLITTCTHTRMYLDHLKFCVVCINGRRYVCCSECNVVSNECDEFTSSLVRPIGTYGGEVITLGVFALGVNLVS